MAVGTLLETYLARFGVRADEVSLETIAFRAALDAVARVEPAVADAIVRELADQRSHLKLIASENYASPAVLLAMGNWFSAQAFGAAWRSLPGGRFHLSTPVTTSAGSVPSWVVVRRVLSAPEMFGDACPEQLFALGCITRV
jgi:hypothetical protein